jgi:hypothetical protein
MIELIVFAYIAYGVFSFWPLALVDCDYTKGAWYEWLAAWAAWTFLWPIRYAQDAWYWWRAKK